jgi:hypothetical protein
MNTAYFGVCFVDFVIILHGNAACVLFQQRSMKVQITVAYRRKLSLLPVTRRSRTSRTTAPKNATRIDSRLIPLTPAPIPSIEVAIQPPSNPPTIPMMMSPRTPWPPPFITIPANQPAINPTTIQDNIPILILCPFSIRCSVCAHANGGIIFTCT